MHEFKRPFDFDRAGIGVLCGAGFVGFPSANGITVKFETLLPRRRVEPLFRRVELPSGPLCQLRQLKLGDPFRLEGFQFVFDLSHVARIAAEVMDPLTAAAAEPEEMTSYSTTAGGDSAGRRSRANQIIISLGSPDWPESAAKVRPSAEKATLRTSP